MTFFSNSFCKEGVVMRLHGKGWAFAAAVALVVGVTSTALAIEAFQERFEWGDMSKPTTLQGRVIILDPYDEAVWINIAVFGGNAESGYYWQKIHPGKNLKFYAAKKEAACQGKDEFDKACYEAKKTLNTSPKGKDTVPMQYDVMLPGGKTLVSGITPWSANEDTGAGH